MAWQKIWLLPLSAVLVTLSSFIASYTIAVLKNHVEPLLPYISVTGSIPPESCVFGQLLNMGALLTALVMYLRHRQIVEYYGHRHQRRRDGARWRFISDLMLWAGYLCVFGLSIVANFQESASIVMHLLGAALAFGFGLVYIWAQTIYAYRMQPRMCDLRITHARLVLCLLATVLFTTLWSTSVKWPCSVDGVGRSDTLCDVQRNDTTLGGWSEDGRHTDYWQSDMEGFTLHIISAISEWSISLVFLAYFLSFILELRYVQVTPPRLRLTEKGRQYLLSLTGGSSVSNSTNQPPAPIAEQINSERSVQPSGESATTGGSDEGKIEVVFGNFVPPPRRTATIDSMASVTSDNGLANNNTIAKKEYY